MHKLIVNYHHLAKEIVDLFRSSKEVVYYSAWVINFNCYLNDTTTFLDLIEETAKRGVKIYILLNENLLYPFSIPIKLPENVSLKTVKSFGKKFIWYSNLYGRCFVVNNRSFKFEGKKNCHHQKYMMVDHNFVLVGGTDIEEKRLLHVTKKNTFHKNILWREIGFILNCDKAFSQFCEENHFSCGCSIIKSNQWVGSFRKVNTEQQAIINLINNANQSVYIENQYFFTKIYPTHDVIHTLVDKIITMYKANKKFSVVVVTNSYAQDMRNLVTRICFNIRKIETFSTIFSSLRKQGIFHNQVDSFFKVCKLKNQFDQEIFIHSKLLITDRKNILVSSSNITDRSLGYGLSDTELGVLLHHEEKVAHNYLETLLDNNLKLEPIKSIFFKSSVLRFIFLLAVKPLEYLFFGFKSLDY